jgi:hypothetical protein
VSARSVRIVLRAVRIATAAERVACWHVCTAAAALATVDTEEVG